jgi:hypothetical protein
MFTGYLTEGPVLEAPMFWITFSTIDWSAFSWLEGDFALLSTVRANCLVHSPRTKSTSFITHYLSPLFNIAIQEESILKGRS